MKQKLNPRLSSGDWKNFYSRFHFDSGEGKRIQAIYTAMLPLVDAYGYYSLEQNLAEISLPYYAYGFVTLGSGVDELSELYLQYEQIQEAYIIDCLCLELLTKAYEEFSQVVEQKSGLFLKELSFLGDTYPLDLLPDIYASLQPENISLTEGQMLKPLKTATLILNLDTERHKNLHQLCNSCETCKNLTCPTRKAGSIKIPQTYGAMQIFHKK